MSWQTADGHGKSSLSAWLQAQGFIDTVTSAVRKGELDKPDVERLKQLRVDARGDGGVLSHAQKRSVKPQQVSLRRGKLVYFQVAPPVGEGRTAKETDQPHSEIAALRQELKALKESLRPTKRSGRKCFGCGQMGHLLASCPLSCSGCGERGHLAADCPHDDPRKTLPSASAAAAAVEEPEDADAEMGADAQAARTERRRLQKLLKDLEGCGLKDSDAYAEAKRRCEELRPSEPQASPKRVHERALKAHEAASQAVAQQQAHIQELEAEIGKLQQKRSDAQEGLSALQSAEATAQLELQAAAAAYAKTLRSNGSKEAAPAEAAASGSAWPNAGLQAPLGVLTRLEQLMADESALAAKYEEYKQGPPEADGPAQGSHLAKDAWIGRLLQEQVSQAATSIRELAAPRAEAEPAEAVSHPEAEQRAVTPNGATERRDRPVRPAVTALPQAAAATASRVDAAAQQRAANKAQLLEAARGSGAGSNG